MLVKCPKFLLDHFEELVRRGEFRKVDYEVWRKLKKYENITWDICRLLSGSIKIFSKDDISFIYYFEHDDCSFGSFLYNQFNNIKNENKNEKEIDKKMMKGFNFDFGPCNGDMVRISMYGIAIKNTAGTWVSYNPKDNSVIDVDVFSFNDAGKFMYKMPVAIKDVAVGDVIVHNRVPVFVTDISDGNITVVDIRAGEKKEILPVKSMFGFDFVTKIVSLFNAVSGAPSPEQPFGNMLPFLMLNGEEGSDIDPMMLMLMMQNQGGDASAFLNNPMMLYCLMKDKDNDMLPLLFMMNQK